MKLKLTKEIICISLIGIYTGLCVKIGCIFRKLVSIPCPGCGLTRAYKSLIHGNIDLAFYYHPLFWTIPITIILCILKSKQDGIIVGIITLLFIITYIIRFLTNTLV